jgi:LysM repeat protein
VTVVRGDTLSRIAERCNVSEGRLMRANPRVDASDDLRAGMQLKLSAGADRALTDRFRSFADQAGDTLSGLANDIGSSVDDLLDKNPDLRSRLRSVGDRLNIPGVNAETAKVSVSPERGAVGSSVTVSAVGLPPDRPVVIGAGPPGQAYEVLDRGRTTPAGTLQATVEIPRSAEIGKPLRIVVSGAEGQWSARSSSFDVEETKL